LKFNEEKSELTFKVPNDTDFDALTPELLKNIISLLPRNEHQDLDIEMAAIGDSNQT
jgi:hypothetical protein